ncbi:MAG: DUF5675 family protein [Alphaproteobacteria bacterium]|nr:DUF5675 family protein [Alphaproteobacteria bacterium]
MQLTLTRFLATDDATFGLLRVDGAPECFTLEDEARDVKVMHETRIPAGTYRITLRDEGGMTGRYAKRFPEFHRGMLWLRDVPGFEWIYIHLGNTDDDTSGCILVGQQPRLIPGRPLLLRDSAPAYRRLYAKCVDAAEAGNLSITIIDGD